MFIPKRHRQMKQTHTTWCQFCCAIKKKKDMFRIRDGPVTWYMCDLDHAECWLEYKYRMETFGLMRMNYEERLAFLNGRDLLDVISKMFPDECEHRESSQS